MRNTHTQKDRQPKQGFGARGKAKRAAYALYYKPDIPNRKLTLD
jgi:hypothetical protein